MHRKRTNERERRKIPDKKRCDGTTEGRRRSELVSQALPRFPAAESVACWSLQRKTRLYTSVSWSVLVKPQRHLKYSTRFKRQVLFSFPNLKYSEKSADFWSPSSNWLKSECLSIQIYPEALFITLWIQHFLRQWLDALRARVEREEIQSSLFPFSSKNLIAPASSEVTRSPSVTHTES